MLRSKCSTGLTHFFRLDLNQSGSSSSQKHHHAGDDDDDDNCDDVSGASADTNV